jgi:dTDP-4-dehydrorhamnose 3,5-epimerase
VKVTPTEIADVLLIEPVVHGDGRGFFLETWRAPRYRHAGIEYGFVQDNHSRSVAGTLRGLHYQVEQPQGKLVSVITGSVYDVAVDLRESSASFGRWVGAVLSEQNHHQLWIPPGFAHGFYVLSQLADVTYKCTAAYAAEHERCIRWDDRDLAIAWPLIGGAAPLLSARDAAGSAFREADTYP